MEKRTGRQEPTLSRILPYLQTDGNKAVALYEKTGRKAMLWQAGLLADILAKNEEGKWIHSKYGYEVPRRNGKGEVILARELYALAMGEMVLHTAHLTATAHSAWKRLCGILDRLGISYSKIKAKGQEYIAIKNGGSVDFRTRTSTGALGEGFDLLIIDEAQEYKVEHQTALKYVVSASANPQTIMCGTPPTAVSSGTVFNDFRESVLAGKTVNSGWAEWSVQEISDPLDRELWYFCNPSLGTTLDERAIMDEVGDSDAERIDFNIQRLGLWLKYSQKSAISETVWNARKVQAPEVSGKLCIGIKYNRDATSVSMALAVYSGNNIFVEILGRRSTRDGNAWILDGLKTLGKNVSRVVIDGAGGAEILTKEMKDAKMPPPIWPKVKEVIEANQAFENAVYQGTICHAGQPSLRDVVSNCTHRAIGAAGGFGFSPLNEALDISLMESAALAYWGRKSFKDVTQKISY